MSEWISVKERLPDYPNVVLISIDFGVNNLVEISRYLKLTQRDFDNGIRRSWSFTGEPSYEENQITHWMPLPEPPK